MKILYDSVCINGKQDAFQTVYTLTRRTTLAVVRRYCDVEADFQVEFTLLSHLDIMMSYDEDYHFAVHNGIPSEAVVSEEDLQAAPSEDGGYPFIYVEESGYPVVGYYTAPFIVRGLGIEP